MDKGPWDDSEYLAAVTRPHTDHAAVAKPGAVESERFFAQRFEMAEDKPAGREQLLSLLRTVSVGARQVHGANVMATMLANGITGLLTFNIADFQRFRGWIKVEAPEAGSAGC